MRTYPRPMSMAARILALKAKGHDREEIAGIVGRNTNYVSAVISGFKKVQPGPMRECRASAADMRARRNFVDQRKAAFKRAAEQANGAAHAQ